MWLLMIFVLRAPANTVNIIFIRPPSASHFKIGWQWIELAVIYWTEWVRVLVQININAETPHCEPRCDDPWWFAVHIVNHQWKVTPVRLKILRMQNYPDIKPLSRWIHIKINIKRIFIFCQRKSFLMWDRVRLYTSVHARAVNVLETQGPTELAFLVFVLFHMPNAVPKPPL